MSQLSIFPPRPPQISGAHLERWAVVYVRQSTVAQVHLNTGSTARQYEQQELARAWGWPEARILVVDADLGVSGAVVGGRSGFAHVLTLIKQGQVGALFVVNADRLARNLVEFSEIVTACDKQHVPLVIDGQVRDLRESGDRLLTSILGVFAEHENRDRQHRLRQSLLAKIRDQHLAQGPPPAGYEAPVDPTSPSLRRRRWGSHWVKSPDSAVVAAIEKVFTTFRLQGSVGAVVREFRRQELQIPRRIMNGQQYGDVKFFVPNHARVRAIIRNPNFTDAFVYSKTEQHITGRLQQDGSGPLKAARRPPNEWVVVHQHHEGYLSWEEFLSNQGRMRANQNTRTAVPRSGPAFLSRLLRCGRCGHAMSVHYGRGRQTIARGQYQCHYQGSTRSGVCQTVSASYVDPPVICAVLQLLAALTPQAVKEALVQEQQQHLEHQRQHVHVFEEANAAVALAERRYKAVDPDNALVRQRLEKDYEDALRRRTECELTLARLPMPVVPATGPNDAQTLLQVAGDVQRVWQHPAVTNEERKEILRALVERISCYEHTPGVLDLELQWHGGMTSAVRVYRPSAFKHLIVEHWQRGETVEAIAASLNAAGMRTTQHFPWSASTVEHTIYKHARQTARWQATRQRLLALHAQGLSGQAVAEALNAGGWRALSNRPWTGHSVGIALSVLARAQTEEQEDIYTVDEVSESK